jgi:signal transduction histidine kinase
MPLVSEELGRGPMPRPQRRAVSGVVWSICGLVVLLSAAEILLLLINGRRGGEAIYGITGASVAGPIAFAGVGALAASRQPRNAVGWLFLAAGVSWVLPAAAQQYAIRASFVAPGTLPGGVAAAWLGTWTFAPIVSLLGIFLPLLFPNGELPSPRWRFFARGIAVVAIVALVIDAIPPASLAVNAGGELQNSSLASTASQNALSNIAGLLQLVLSAGALIAIVGMIIRYRRSQAELRQQLKWFLFAVSILVLALIATAFASTPTESDVASALFVLASLGLPAATGIAIFKYHLYGIDVVISRTLVYGALAVVITAVYVGIAVGIGTLVGSGGKPNLALSILATGIVAVGFQPLRERLQRVANRLVYGKRATPYEVLSQFAERVAESYASEDVLPRMARALAEGTSAERAEVWLRSGGGFRPAASFPIRPTPAAVVLDNAEPAPILPADRTVEVRHQRDLLGALSVTKRRGESLTPTEVKLMDDLAFPLESSVPGAVQLDSVASANPNADRTVEVRHQGQLLGALTVTKRRGESLTPIEIKLMDDLAHQAGLVLKNVGLTADLQARLDDLRASRQRLVAAQDDERRRLERNLHDGAQQYLVAIKVKLGLVEMLSTKDPEKARATVVALKLDAEEALETLRDLARGIYPPLLADKGLAVALQAHARKATLPVQVDADGIGRYPQEMEAALYFFALEALQNVQKYADASSATVQLREDPDQLHVEVADDGRGFDVTAVKRGAGLTNMEDRLDALGGTLQIYSSPGHGTTLRATVPLLAPSRSRAESGWP